MFLNEKSFKNIVKYSPIAAIDLCILNDSKEILLGKRINHPQKFFLCYGEELGKARLYLFYTKDLKE